MAHHLGIGENWLALLSAFVARRDEISVITQVTRDLGHAAGMDDALGDRHARWRAMPDISASPRIDGE